MWQEFRSFAFKGNAFDLAVGVIIGVAFSKIVNSIVNDLIMPIIGAIFGGLDFSNYFLRFRPTVTATSLAQAREQGAVFAYGNFITVLINFADHRLDPVPAGQGGQQDAEEATAGTAARAHTNARSF